MVETVDQPLDDEDDEELFWWGIERGSYFLTCLLCYLDLCAKKCLDWSHIFLTF